MRADIAHGRAQPAHQLVDDRDDRALVRHATLDALGHELVGRCVGILEVAIRGALLHRAQRAHAAIDLVGAALIELDLARGLLGPGEHRTQHHAVRARGDRLGQVPGETHAAVGDQRHAGALKRLGHIRDRGDLRHAHAGHNAGGADRARPDPHLHAVRSGRDQVLRGGGGGDVAADHLHVRVVLLHPGNAVEHALGMTMCGIHHQHVHPGLDQRGHALVRALAHANRRTHAQAAALVLGGIRMLGGLLDVLDRNHPAQLEVVVDHQHLLDAVLVQQFQHHLAVGPLGHGHQPVARGHDLGDRRLHAGLEAQVTGGHNTDQVIAIHHRHARDVIGLGQFHHLADSSARADGDRLADHAAFVFLDLPDLGRLGLHRHVLVDDTEPALLSHRDRQAGLGNRIHCRRHHRGGERDLAGDPGTQIDIARNDIRMSRDQQHVIKGKGFTEYPHAPLQDRPAGTQGEEIPGVDK